jgi:hypothetical protein
MLKEFFAKVTDPSGFSDRYDVVAENKTEARKKIAKIYRNNTPPPSAGFYSFSKCRIEWIEN